MDTTFIENLARHLKDKSLKVASFDFFDTLVSRRTPHPKDVFSVIGHRLNERGVLRFDVSPERFMQLRIEAETNARKERIAKEITLQDIYAQFPNDMLNGSIAELIQIEVETEKDFVFPVYNMIELVKLAAKRGKKVIVVSDTYLSAQNIKDLWGDITPEVDITFFASSEYQTGKSENLFNVVLKKLKIEASSMLHTGDNYHSDVHTPASLGIRSFFLPHGSTLFWSIFSREVSEGDRLSHRITKNYGDCGITALRCKTSHYLPTQAVDATSYQQYGAQILGPALSTFIHWVRANALREGVRVIMPLMREGHIIDKLLTFYDDHSFYSRPAYLSRRILLQASLVNADENALRSLRFDNLESTVEQYLSLLGLHTSEVPELVARLDNQISDDGEFNGVVRTLVENKSIITRLRARAMDIRRGIVRHIINLATVNGEMVERAIVVDVGWNGTIQKLLQRIIDEEGIKLRVTGLYMMTTPAVNGLIFENILAKGFFVDGGMPNADFQTLSRTLEIFEQSCSPAHGSVLRHNVSTGAPTLMVDKVPTEQRADIDDIQTGILCFHELFLRNFPDIDVAAIESLSSSVRAILRRAMLMPTEDEVALFKDWLHDDNLASNSTTPILGTAASREFFPYKTMSQLMATKMNEIYWPFGALVIADPQRAKILALASINSLPLDVFDTDTGLSTELATGTDDKFDSGVPSHQPVLRNLNGKTYVRFLMMPVDKNTVLRWTPAPSPFDLQVDFVVFTFKNEVGLTTQARVEGHRLMDIATVDGMQDYTSGAWRGQGQGSAFYFSNLRHLGVTSKGTLTMEIAYSFHKLVAMPQMEKHDNFEYHFEFNEIAMTKEGISVLDVVNGKQIEKDTAEFSCSSGTFSFSGWMVDTDSALAEGRFFARFTNAVGEARFAALQTVRRQDLAAHFKLDAMAYCGFSASEIDLPNGVYIMTILRKANTMCLISKTSWRVIVGSTMPTLELLGKKFQDHLNQDSTGHIINY